MILSNLSCFGRMSNEFLQGLSSLKRNLDIHFQVFFLYNTNKQIVYLNKINYLLCYYEGEKLSKRNNKFLDRGSLTVAIIIKISNIVSFVYSIN